MWAKIASFLIERWNANCVQVTMSRPRMILVSLLPVLMLLASANCFGAPVCSCNSGDSISFSGEQGKRHTASCENSFLQAARPWSRRINVQSGAHEFASPVATAKCFLCLRDQTVAFEQFVHLTPDLAQSWQFHWRTALLPRAPSSLS